MKKIAFILLFIFNISHSFASSDSSEPLVKKDWSFEGFLGRFDIQSIQRGFQIYKEICSACHAIDKVYYRNLLEIGFTEKEAKAIAEEYIVIDGPNDQGELYERKARLSDPYNKPYLNELASRAVNNGAFPPDLSLIVKSRPDGANYIFSLLQGYLTPHKTMVMEEGMNYNIYFSGKQIAMSQPLVEDQIEYYDGTRATLKQMSSDIVNFLQWTAEPEMEMRKKMGIKVLIFLLIFTILFFIVKKRIWSRLD